MKMQTSGSMGDSQRQPVTKAAPSKIGARGLQPVTYKQSVKGGPRKQKSGSQGG